MFFKVQESFLQEIYSFTEQANTPIAQMAKKPPHLICLMIVVNMKVAILLWAIRIWRITANQAFTLLTQDHPFISLYSNSIAAEHAIGLRIFEISFSKFRIFSTRLISGVMAFLTDIKPSIFIKIFMEFLESERFMTEYTFFKFIYHV